MTEQQIIDAALEIQHHFGGGVYAKQALIRAGMCAAQHVHKHDHLSILASGRVLVEVDGVATERTGPTAILIGAGKAHKVTALTDASWFCVHATAETDPEHIDHTLIAEAA